MLRAKVHPTAIVGKGVSLEEGCHIAAHSVLQGGVKVGIGSFIAENVTIQGSVSLGKHCYVGQNSVLGFPTRDSITRILKGSEASEVISPIQIGDDVSIRTNCTIYEDVTLASKVRFGHNVMVREDVTVGAGTLLGTNSVIDGHCKIGSNVSIQSGVYVCTYTEIEDFVFMGPNCVMTNDKYVMQSPYKLKGPILRRGVSVGANALIMPGVEVGAGSVIGSGAVVTKKVPRRVIVLGVPGRIWKNVPARWHMPESA